MSWRFFLVVVLAFCTMLAGARSRVDTAQPQESERSVDLSVEFAVNDDSNSGAAEVLLWVTNHDTQVAYD